MDGLLFARPNPEPYLQSRKEVNTYTTYLVFIVETFSSDIDVVIPKLRLF